MPAGPGELLDRSSTPTVLAKRRGAASEGDRCSETLAADRRLEALGMASGILTPIGMGRWHASRVQIRV